MAQSLNIVIIGAGIAGTIAARVLRESHNVTLLEKFSAEHELGAAINLGPNAVKIVDKYGFDRKRAGSIIVGRSRVLDTKGNMLQESPIPNLREHFGSDWIVQHRADLWNEFFTLATAPSETLGISGAPAKIVWSAEVVNVDVDSGDVTLADGRVFLSDLVIGADGVKSVVRPFIVGEAAFSTARPSGSSAFRFMLPREVVERVAPNLSVMDKTKPAEIDIYLAQDDTKRSIVNYPCRDFELLNFGCLGLDSFFKLDTTESWSCGGTRADLLRCFGDFTFLRPLLEQAENIKLWQLRDQEPLPTYIKGRAVIIGDAAHAMTPHQGQGGSQAVEDAEAFSLLIDQVVDRAMVPTLLQDFNRVRCTRASNIQRITRNVHENKTPENIWKNMQYNFSYSGVRDCLLKLDAGLDI